MENPKSYSPSFSPEVEALAAKYGVRPEVVADLIGAGTASAAGPKVVIQNSVKGAAYRKAMDEGFAAKEPVVVQRSWSFSGWTVLFAIAAIVALVALLKGCPEEAPNPYLPDTTAAVIPEPDTVVQHDTTTVTLATAPDAPKPAASRITARRSTRRASARPSLSTTSSYQAQQKLASMRAEGNSGARIGTTKRNGETLYQVFAK